MLSELIPIWMEILPIIIGILFYRMLCKEIDLEAFAIVISILIAYFIPHIIMYLSFYIYHI